jgi:hypothetical protein
MLGTILIVLLILMLLGAIPRGGGYSRNWGYFPSGVLGVALLVVVVLLLTGRV